MLCQKNPSELKRSVKLSKPKKGPLSVLKDINLEIGQEQFIAIIGPSGCGKSTLLKIIAGLDNDYEGAVYLGEEKVNSASIEKGFIFFKSIGFFSVADGGAKYCCELFLKIGRYPQKS